MPQATISQLFGINLYVNPLNQNNGELIRSVNYDSYPYGSKQKRLGYDTYLGTADGDQVNTLFNWTKNDGTTFFNYRASGSLLYYSIQGTGAWTVAGNGTISDGASVGYAVLDNTLILGDGVGSTRHTTNGTSFTNTTLAPIGSYFAQYQGRIFIGGTSSTLFFSTANDATNWETSGTSDSSSFTIPGAGKINSVFVSSDRLIASKNSGLMYRWDGDSLTDMSTRLGPSSPNSLASQGGFWFWLNRVGIHGYGGARPQLLSNSIQPLIYNRSGSAVAGTAFDTAPAEVFRYDYLLSAGDVTEDFTNRTISNCILKYDYQKNEFLTYSFGTAPTAFTTYVDASGDEQLIFGDSAGQCYTYGNSITHDNGAPIESELMFMFHGGVPHLQKDFIRLYAFMNPGNEARIQVSVSDSYSPASQQWFDLGDCSSGVIDFRFDAMHKATGKLLFVRVTENSQNSECIFYGYTIDAIVKER